MNQVSPPPSESPVRWTYDGTMDDKVADYPWPGISAVKTKGFLDSHLTCSAVQGTPLLLNDGYLVFNRACLESLHDHNSQLRVLIRKQYVKVLARDPQRSLEGMVRHGAAQDLENRKGMLNSPEWTDTRRVLSEVEAELRENNGMVGWPRVLLARSYWELIQLLASPPYEEVLLRDGVPYQIFKEVAERFDNAMSKEAIAPRKKWEELVNEVVREVGGTQDDIDRLMHLANEVYHHNFGAALQSRPPDEMKNAEIAVQTRISEALSSFSKTHALGADSAGSVVPEVVLPNAVNYSNNNLLSVLFDKDHPLGNCRTEYLKLRGNYRAGHVPTEEMASKQDEYQRRLNEHLLPFIPAPVTSTAANVGLALLTERVLGPVLGDAPALLVAVLGALRDIFGTGVIVERWHVGNLERKVRLKVEGLCHKLSGRKVVTSLAVNPTEAHRLVDRLPVV